MHQLVVVHQITKLTRRCSNIFRFKSELVFCNYFLLVHIRFSSNFARAISSKEPGKVRELVGIRGIRGISKIRGISRIRRIRGIRRFNQEDKDDWKIKKIKFRKIWVSCLGVKVVNNFEYLCWDRIYELKFYVLYLKQT